ncbi:hypothetical protein O5269_26375, partial [Escherichia coli]|nr:hypothetical protein [Escherichia coli]
FANLLAAFLIDDIIQPSLDFFIRTQKRYDFLAQMAGKAEKYAAEIRDRRAGLPAPSLPRFFCWRW